MSLSIPLSSGSIRHNSNGWFVGEDGTFIRNNYQVVVIATPGKEWQGDRLYRLYRIDRWKNNGVYLLITYYPYFVMLLIFCWGVDIVRPLRGRPDGGGDGCYK